MISSEFSIPLSPGMVDASTGERSVALATAQALVDSARRAQPAWAARGTASRAQVIDQFRRLVYEQRAEIAALVTDEVGKPLAESYVAEVSMTLDGARFLSRIAARTLRTTRRRTRTLAAWRKTIITHHEPFGVVAVVSPWNYPFFFPAMHVMTALVAGNAVVLKPSELSPRCAVLLVQLLHAAGVPEEIVSLLPGDGRVGAALVSANVDKVFFTGSERTGRSIAMACAPRFVPVSLELGGSDAAIVREDADIAHATSGILWARFTNAGQTCVAVKRVIAVGRAYDALIASLAVRVPQLQIESEEVDGRAANRDLGPLVSAPQRALIREQLNDALSRGASVIARADPTSATERSAPAVVLGNVTPEMRVWHEETFGPVLAVVRAASDDEAVALANSTRFGLSASVWTTDRATGRALAARLDAGAVCLNDAVISAGLPEVAHGGNKASGLGRIHGVEGLRECVRTHTVIDDMLPTTRQAWWFGYGEQTATRIGDYIRLAHGRSLFDRLGGIAGTLRLLLRPERPL